MDFSKQKTDAIKASVFCIRCLYWRGLVRFDRGFFAFRREKLTECCVIGDTSDEFENQHQADDADSRVRSERAPEESAAFSVRLDGVQTQCSRAVLQELPSGRHQLSDVLRAGTVELFKGLSDGPHAFRVDIARLHLTQQFLILLRVLHDFLHGSLSAQVFQLRIFFLELADDFIRRQLRAPLLDRPGVLLVQSRSRADKNNHPAEHQKCENIQDFGDAVPAFFSQVFNGCWLLVLHMYWSLRIL